MNPTPIEVEFFNWIAGTNYYLMQVADKYTLITFALFTLIGTTFGMSPLKSHPDHDFGQSILVKARQGMLIFTAAILAMILVMGIVYGQTVDNPSIGYSAYGKWFFNAIISRWYLIPVAAFLGFSIQFIFKRYLLTLYSGVLRKLRNNLTKDKQSDIRDDSGNTKVKDFTPSKQYKKEKVFFGLGEDDKPLFVPQETWYETNMQVIGPTRYGKGVMIGGLMDQSIKRGDCVFYIDPKKDKFAPHVMYQAARAAGKKFYYVDLNDHEVSKWAPFAGGSPNDAFSRFETAFGLELTGDPGTDFYKTQELKEARLAFDKTNSLEGLKSLIEGKEAAKLEAELDKWCRYSSLTPKKGKGFNIGKAIEEGAVVFVRGSLDDSTIKTATKAFIAEMVQEARRLEPKRESHATFFVDEVSFLVSKILTQALATIVGFRVNMVLAYQSQEDLLSVDDKSLNPKYVYNSVNVNCQLKVVHGGADIETAKNISELSGTVIKEVTQREQTDISATGGETWVKQRTVAGVEEALITANKILTLPPRVSVLIRPTELATICYSSFVPVKNMNDLSEYIEKKRRPQIESTKTPADSIELHGIEDKVSPAKQPLKKEPQITKKEGNTNKKTQVVSPAKQQDKQQKEEGRLPRWNKPKKEVGANTPTTKQVTKKEESNIQEKDSTQPEKQEISDDNPFFKVAEEKENEKHSHQEDEREKEREKRRKRKQQQAAKKSTKSIATDDKVKPSTEPESPNLKGLLSKTKSDNELLSLLNDDSDEE
jgi:type IV secretory pathway TraG/TraD family ATPase VirD4